VKKRIVILGGGESGVGAALLAKEMKFEVFVSDNGPLKAKHRDELNKHEIEFEESKHTEKKILNANTVIKSPGISDSAAIVKQVKANNIPIVDEIEFAFNYIKGKVIAVTGTNGKTTTTLLIYHLLKTAGLNVCLAGNVGESLAKKVALGVADWYVVELSSFQLDGVITFKPDVAILLNITPDHLDRYDNKISNYIDSKFKMIRNMGQEDYFIYYVDDPIGGEEAQQRSTEAYRVGISMDQNATSAVRFDGQYMVFQFGKNNFKISSQEVKLKGEHNIINTMAAASAAFLANVSPTQISEGLKTFVNAPHRLEPIATINGVEFVNDSKATNVFSTKYAIESFNQPIIWIVGGYDKGNDYNILKDLVVSKVKSIVCLGKDNSKIVSFFGQIEKSIYDNNCLSDAVSTAFRIANPGDVILLSPACASFDLFDNYEDRGNKFREEIRLLEKRNNNF